MLVVHITGPFALKGKQYHRTNLIRPTCPKNLQKDQTFVEGWLQNAIRRGNFGKFDQGFPRVVWYEEDGRLFEERSSGQGSCEYHGYPLALMIKL